MSILVILAVSVFFLIRRSKRTRGVEAALLDFSHRVELKSTEPNSYQDKRGYLRFRDSNKLVHRYVAEKKLGRALENWEVVHHVDGNKLNNRHANLEVCSREEHDAIHRRNQLVYGSWHPSNN